MMRAEFLTSQVSEHQHQRKEAENTTESLTEVSVFYYHTTAAVSHSDVHNPQHHPA